MSDMFQLPSGSTISIDRPDFSACKTVEDFMEVKYALSEKVIAIELQIDMHEVNGRPGLPDWLPRAKASLRWAKLYRDEAQNRQGQRQNIENAQTHATLERGVMDILKGILPKKDYDHLIKIGSLVAEGKLVVSAKKP